MRCALAVVFVFVPGFALALSDLDDGWAMMQRHICGKSKPDKLVECYLKSVCREKMRIDDADKGIADGIDMFLIAHAQNGVRACRVKGMQEWDDGG